MKIKMSHWPEGWAARGTAQSVKSRDPQKSMSLSFRSIIEGSHYERKVCYVPVDEQPAEGEKLARVIHNEGYPSGGSAEYASHSYWDGMQWHDDGEWVHNQRSLFSKNLEWFRIERV